jgi:hypothetical protein
MTYQQEFDYDPGRFSDLWETERGGALWEFVTSRDTMIRMAEASDRGKPAVVALGSREMMIKRFGEEVTGDRWKQLIGLMVRKAMETGPWEHAAQGLKVGGDSMFTKGSRYRRRAPRWGFVDVEGRRPGGGLLYADLGVDSLDHALVEINGFLAACVREEIPSARIETREVGASPSRKPTKVVRIAVRGGQLAPVIEQVRSALVAAVAPRIDFDIALSHRK